MDRKIQQGDNTEVEGYSFERGSGHSTDKANQPTV